MGERILNLDLERSLKAREQPTLGPQQRRIKELRASGLRNVEIAEILGLSPRTVRGVIFKLRQRGVFVKSCRKGPRSRGGFDRERNRARRQRKYAAARAAGAPPAEARNLR